MKKFKLILILVISVLLNIQFANADWVRTNGLNGDFVYSMLVRGNNIFAGTQSGTYLSTNAGDNWQQVFNISARSLTSSGSNIYAGTQSNGVYLSTNNGVNWTQVNNGLTGNYIRAMTSSGNNIYAGTTTAGVFLSTNNGTNWTPINNGLTNIYIFSLLVNNGVLYAGTGPSDGGIFRSTNNGQNWTFSGAQNQFVYALTANNTNVFAGTDLAGIFTSTNNGISWTQVNNGISNMFINSMLVYNQFTFAGSQSGMLFSANNGGNWFNFSQGLPNNWFYATVTDSSYLYTGVYGGNGGVYRRPISDLLSVHQTNSEVPEKYVLSQNYPNPFNPTTTIRFDIPPLEGVRGRVATLVIYDILGREITTLVNQQLQPGSYEVSWDASDYPSSVYFYKIIVGDYSDSKKMILIK